MLILKIVYDFNLNAIIYLFFILEKYLKMMAMNLYFHIVLHLYQDIFNYHYIYSNFINFQKCNYLSY
jgi:hypothetical protein